MSPCKWEFNEGGKWVDLDSLGKHSADLTKPHKEIRIDWDDNGTTKTTVLNLGKKYEINLR
jgi:hypothetical protein